MSTVVTNLKNTPLAEPSADTKPAATRKAKAKPAAKKEPPAKKAAKKAPATPPVREKAAKPEKAATKAEPTERRGAFSNDAVINVLRTDHGLRGLRAEALDCLKNGTVADFKKALAKKEAAGSNRLSTYTGWALKTAIAAKMITVKDQ
jgi:hypothetical protein